MVHAAQPDHGGPSVDDRARLLSEEAVFGAMTGTLRGVDEAVADLKAAIYQTRNLSGDAVLLFQQVYADLAHAHAVIDKLRSVSPEMVIQAELEVALER